MGSILEESIRLRATVNEVQHWDRVAELRGMTRSELMRDALHRAVPFSAVDLVLLRAEALWRHDETGVRSVDVMARAVAQTGTGNVTGGSAMASELDDYVDARRLLVNSAAPFPLPPGVMQVTRPKVTVGPPADTDTEFLQVPNLTVTAHGLGPASVTAEGGFIRAAEQVRDWADAGLLQQLLDGCADRLVMATERKAAAAVEAASADSVPLAVDADLADFLVAVNSAMGTVSDNLATGDDQPGQMPNVVWASTEQWLRLMAMTDTNGLPAVPRALAEYGITLVPSAGFTDDFLAVAHSQAALAVWERNRGLTTDLTSPAHLELTITYASFFAAVADGAAIVTLDATS